jgi:hypothetical protein
MCQNGISAVVTIIIEPKCLNSPIGNMTLSPVNIDVSTLLNTTQQKNAKTIKRF